MAGDVADYPLDCEHRLFFFNPDPDRLKRERVFFLTEIHETSRQIVLCSVCRSCGKRPRRLDVIQIQMLHHGF